MKFQNIPQFDFYALHFYATQSKTYFQVKNCKLKTILCTSTPTHPPAILPWDASKNNMICSLLLNTYSWCWEEKLSLKTFYIPDLYGGLYLNCQSPICLDLQYCATAGHCWPTLFFPVWTVSNIRLKCFDSLYHRLHLSVHMWGLNIFKIMFYLGWNMICFATKHSKFGVVGCCQLDLFSLNKIFFARIFSCFWARNMPESWEKWNMSRTCWSKSLNIIISDLRLARQFALTGVKLQCLVAKHVMSGTLFI